MPRPTHGRLAAAALLAAIVSTPAGAQPADGDPAEGAAAPVQAPDSDEFIDFELDPLQPDFTLVALPTTLRLPARHSAFRVTHRFTRPLTQGTFGQLAEGLFGLDGPARVGLEFRYGLAPGTQLGVHRTSDRTIQLFGQHNVRRERDGHAVGLDVLLSVEGLNNFRERYSPALGLIVSRTVGGRAALYLQPIWVGDVNLVPGAPGGRHAFLVGLGGRWRIRPTVYLVGEVAPRVAGLAQDAAHASLAIEKRAGGHAFQFNFSNGFGTTYGQIARGGRDHSDWHLGFNISRKFF